jgi:hypothetical protein
MNKTVPKNNSEKEEINVKALHMKEVREVFGQ